MIKQHPILQTELRNADYSSTAGENQNLLDFIAGRKANFAFETKIKELSYEYERDLNRAVTREYNHIRNYVASETGLSSVLKGLDNTESNDRPKLLETKLEDLVTNFDEDNGRLRFEIVSKEGEPASSGILPDNCSCAITTDGSVAYISGDLGLHDLMLVVHTGILQKLVICAQDAGADTHKTEALHALCGLLGRIPEGAIDRRVFDPVQVHVGLNSYDAFLTASDRSNRSL